MTENELVQLEQLLTRLQAALIAQGAPFAYRYDAHYAVAPAIAYVRNNK